MPATVRSAALAKIARVSLRQLQWWDEQNVCPVSIQKHSREYTASEALWVLIVANLRRCGFAPRSVRHLRLAVEKELLREPNARYLVTDGIIAHAFESETGVIQELTAGASRPRYVLALSEMREKIARAIRANPVTEAVQ